MLRLITLLLCSMLVGMPVNACQTMGFMELRDVFEADLIVVGTLTKYEIVDDGSVGSPSNYARLQLRVEKVLLDGAAETERATTARRLIITWGRSVFGQPEAMEIGKRLLIALRDPSSPEFPLGAESGSFLPSPESEHFTILQKTCSGAFIFDNDGLISIAIQQVFETDRDKELELKVLEEFLVTRGAASRSKVE
jgi:hypothetical protein